MAVESNNTHSGATREELANSINKPIKCYFDACRSTVHKQHLLLFEWFLSDKMFKAETSQNVSSLC